MPRGSKDKFTDKQKKKAANIEQSYERKGVPEEEAKARAWATVNKQSGGGERKGGSGQLTSAKQKATARKDSAKRAVATKHGISREDSLELQTKETLLRSARSKQIPGRSSMNKQELVEALRNAA